MKSKKCADHKDKTLITSYGHQESQIKWQQQGQMMSEKDLKELPAGCPKDLMPTLMASQGNVFFIHQWYVVECVHRSVRVNRCCQRESLRF